MPLNVKDEMQYRRAQRQLGECQVALRLAAGLLKDNPSLPGLGDAVEGLLKAKAGLFRRITAMEQEA